MSGKAEGQGQGTAAFEGESVASVRRRWVAALRSGRYAQGNYALRRIDDTYCCLGVLCDVVDPAGWSAPVINDAFAHGTQETNIGDGMMMAAGLLNRHTSVLISMNDKERASFAEIADYIESLPLPESAS